MISNGVYIEKNYFERKKLMLLFSFRFQYIELSSIVSEKFCGIQESEKGISSNMRSILILLETIVILCVTTLASDATEESTISVKSRRTLPSPSQTENDEDHDTESARKIIGSR